MHLFFWIFHLELKSNIIGVMDPNMAYTDMCFQSHLSPYGLLICDLFILIYASVHV